MGYHALVDICTYVGTAGLPTDANAIWPWRDVWQLAAGANLLVWSIRKLGKGSWKLRFQRRHRCEPFRYEAARTSYQRRRVGMVASVRLCVCAPSPMEGRFPVPLSIPGQGCIARSSKTQGRMFRQKVINSFIAGPALAPCRGRVWSGVRMATPSTLNASYRVQVEKFSRRYRTEHCPVRTRLELGYRSQLLAA